MRFDLLQAHINHYQTVAPSRLYDGTLHYAHDHFANHSGLYAITYSSCLRYRLDACRFLTTTLLEIALTCGTRSLTAHLDLAKFWHMEPSIRAQCPDLAEFRTWLDTQPLHPGKISGDHSTDLHLAIYCPVARQLSGCEEPLLLFVYNLINLLDLDAMVTNEIVYLGLSHQSVIDRVKPHERWGMIAANRPRDLDSLVYFFNLQYSRMQLDSEGSDGKRVPADDLRNEDRLHLAEMHFIWALKPRYNKDYIDDIPADSVYISRAEKLGYDGCYAEMDLEGQLGFVAGPNRQLCSGLRVARRWRADKPLEVLARLPNGTLIPMSVWERLRGL